MDEGGRPAQDTYMLYKCLISSLTKEARKKISLGLSQYRIGQENKAGGVALLKVIIRESNLDTNTTTNQIRTKLSSLDSYITKIDSDIGCFDQYVKLLAQSLTARNQQTSDLLINIFKGYGAVSVKVFRAWLLRKQNDHEECNEITPDKLMQAAKNKYNTMVEKGTGRSLQPKKRSWHWRRNSSLRSKASTRRLQPSLARKARAIGRPTATRRSPRRILRSRATIPRSGRSPRRQTIRRWASSKATCGTGAARTPEEKANVGGLTSRRSARV